MKRWVFFCSFLFFQLKTAHNCRLSKRLKLWKFADLPVHFLSNNNATPDSFSHANLATEFVMRIYVNLFLLPRHHISHQWVFVNLLLFSRHHRSHQSVFFMREIWFWDNSCGTALWCQSVRGSIYFALLVNSCKATCIIMYSCSSYFCPCRSLLWKLRMHDELSIAVTVYLASKLSMDFKYLRSSWRDSEDLPPVSCMSMYMGIYYAGIVFSWLMPLYFHKCLYLHVV